MKFAAIVATVVLSANACFAGQIDGTWSTQEGCTRLERMKTDPDAAWEGNFVEISYLSDKGILGYEWGCDFLDTKTNEYGASVHVSSCSAEGDSWPELLLTKYSQDRGWTVAVTDETGKIREEYYPVRCDQ